MSKHAPVSNFAGAQRWVLERTGRGASPNTVHLGVRAPYITDWAFWD